MDNQRLDDYNNRFIYVETDPENIIPGKKNAYFFRYGTEFYVNPTGNLEADEWIKLPYRTVVLPPPPLTKEIKFKLPYQAWIKEIDGNYDQYGNLLPKQGWKYLGSIDLFSRRRLGKNLNWIFPPPTSSEDNIGNNNSRSYDENYFYAKISGKWYRTPIVRYVEAGPASPDTSYWTDNLPFVAAPRFFPVPGNSVYGAVQGDQTYDLDFFYINVNFWKRSRLLIYTGSHKMARF